MDRSAVIAETWLLAVVLRKAARCTRRHRMAHTTARNHVSAITADRSILQPHDHTQEYSDINITVLRILLEYEIEIEMCTKPVTALADTSYPTRSNERKRPPIKRETHCCSGRRRGHPPSITGPTTHLDAAPENPAKCPYELHQRLELICELARGVLR